MEKSIQLNKGTSLYVYLLAIWVMCVTYVLCTQSKADLFLAINHSFRHTVLDVVQTIFTCIGDGLFSLILMVFFIFTRKRRLAWILLCSFLLSTVFCQVLKNMADELRPTGYFKDPQFVKTAAWVSLRRFNSFPSGHTTTAFATATILAFYYKRVWISAICFLFAVMVGYSRIYLGQHFVGDVFTGSLIGAQSSFICILNYKSLLVQKGLGLEYLFRKKGTAEEQTLESLL
ncbi:MULTISPECIES: phosphatase PAP2 family protein [Chitinophagaceae]